MEPEQVKRLQKHRWKLSLVYLIVVAAILTLVQIFASAPRPKAVSYNEFLAEVKAGRVSEVSVTEQQWIAMLKPEAVQQKGAPTVIETSRLPGINESPLIHELEAHNVKFAGRIQSGSAWTGVLSWLLPLALLALVYGYGMRKLAQGPGGALNIGRNRAKIYDQSSRIGVTFADVAGVDEAKAELVEVVDFLKNPGKYQKLGGRIPKGVLLVGPPGTGKTLLAQAVSGEAGVPFFSISGSEFVEMFVGVGAARVRDLFEQAKQKAPCIIFIDELDAIGKSRSAGRGLILSHDEREQTLNQLLVEMDGFDTSRGVIIMAATNTPEVLDPALLRAGRFDRQVIVDRPDMKGREEILAVHARKIKLAPDVDLRAVAARTPGMVGADLANIVNEAALLAARRSAAQVELRDLEEAVDRVTLGLVRKSRVMSAEEKKRVAYHEAGHALVALSLPHADPVHRVSILPRSIGALGYTLQLPEEKYIMTRPELEDRISVMLGGRACEEIVYNGVVSTGAADDLERASDLARQMVTRFGMSEKLGNLSYGHSSRARFLPVALDGQERNYSERTAEQIDREVRRLVDALYARSRTILENRRNDLDRLVEELMRKETLGREELERLLAAPARVA